jgi:hypothetical protein
MNSKMIVVLALAATSAACGDPSRSAAIAVLGGEQAGFPPNELHRPGQPCVLCHSETGGAEPVLSLGGTLFVEPSPTELYAVADFSVFVFDSEGQAAEMKSNACGNFFIEKKTFNPVFPLRTEIRDSEGKTLNVMNSRIAREGSCNNCHVYPRSPFSPGVIRVFADPIPDPPNNCPSPSFPPRP